MDGGLESKRFSGPGKLDTGFVCYDAVKDLHICFTCRREGKATDFSVQRTTLALFCKPCAEKN